MIRAAEWIGIGIVMLGGCSSAQRRTAWERSFAGQGVAPAPTKSEPEVGIATYERLERNPEVEGWTLLGRSVFTDEKVTPESLAAGGAISEFAKSIGAQRILLADRAAGTQKRTRYLRSASPIAPGGGNFTAPRQPTYQTDSVPITVEVEVFDTILAFYRRVEDGGS